MKTPEISFVIIEYHSILDIFECLQNISQACNDITYEIIISSNSEYPIEQQERLKLDYKGIIWIFNSRNGGFAYGMNCGLSKASGNVIAIMNPDVRLIAGNFRKAFEYLSNHAEVGLIGPKICDKNGRLQDSTRSFMTPLNLIYRQLKRFFLKNDVLIDKKFNSNLIQPVDWVIGAFMMVQKDAYKLVGGLDEGYFLYVEDMDWCKRFWSNGYKVMYFPMLEVEYKGDRKSTATLSSRKMLTKYSFYHLKSYIRFLKKHGWHPTRICH